MYICNNCGIIKTHLPMRVEARGEFWGDNCREKYLDSECSCGGNFEKAIVCPKCGKYFPDENENSDFCPTCRQEIIDKFYHLTCEFTPAEMNLIFDRRI